MGITDQGKCKKKSERRKKKGKGREWQERRNKIVSEERYYNEVMLKTKKQEKESILRKYKIRDKINCKIRKI